MDSVNQVSDREVNRKVENRQLNVFTGKLLKVLKSMLDSDVFFINASNTFFRYIYQTVSEVSLGYVSITKNSFLIFIKFSRNSTGPKNM